MTIQQIDALTNLLVQARTHAMATRGAESIADEGEQAALEKGAHDLMVELERILADAIAGKA